MASRLGCRHDPDATTLKVETSKTSDWYTIFVFDLDNMAHELAALVGESDGGGLNDPPGGIGTVGAGGSVGGGIS